MRRYCATNGRRRAARRLAGIPARLGGLLSARLAIGAVRDRARAGERAALNEWMRRAACLSVGEYVGAGDAQRRPAGMSGHAPSSARW